MLVGKDLKKIKYVAVEVIKDGIAKASNVECGLYMGIIKKLDKDKVERKFLALVVSDASVRLLNMDKYNIMTIDAVDEESRYMTVFTKDDEDQAAAVLLLNEITEKLTDEKRLYPNDPHKEIIDIDTYEDYPPAVLESDNLTGESTSSKSSADTTKSHTGGTSGTTNYNQGSTYTKQEPTVSSIKRKGKLPKKEKLDTMRDKVRRLAEGTFELKALPIPECDKETEEEGKKTGTVGTA